MEIGKKLKEARQMSGLTQEDVAEKLIVSRQTISNWETEKFYPDILYVLQLSDLYQISLDELLKGDERMIQHLEDSTNIVKSNKKILLAFICNICLLFLFFIFITKTKDKMIAEHFPKHIQKNCHPVGPLVIRDVD